MDCPFCHKVFETAVELETHANTHFEDSQPAVAAAVFGVARTVNCCHCGALVAADELASHELAHQLEQEDLKLAATDADAAAAAEELDAQAAADWDGSGGSGSDDDAAHQQQLEELYFEQLRAKYGFLNQLRPGGCRLCGEDGHWAADCPRNPERQQAQSRVLDPPLPHRITATQQPATPTPLPVGSSLIQLLTACLDQQQGLPAGVAYEVAVCGEVQHFGATPYSSGWGCGYNNMQMLASHLLAARPEARQALFGGFGWVPDIPALQAWLEAAWRAGYDEQGTEQLGGRVQGTKKWVGTTECAALLRNFGLRAQVVDFGAQRSTHIATAAAPITAANGSSPAATSSLTGGLVVVHPNVQCDGCWQCPIVGERYSSEVVANYDLCAACHAQSSAEAAGPYRRMMPAAARPNGTQQQRQHQEGGGGSSSGSVREQLLLWVWRYFMNDDEQQPSSSHGGGCSGGAVAGRGGIAVSRQEGGEGGQGAGPAVSKRQRLLAPHQQQQHQQQGRVHVSGRPPLYFQHEGHSRTIVGIERRLVGRERHPQFTLLVLDPSTPGAKLATALQQRTGWQRLLRRGAHTLRHPQYQLLYVQPGLAAGQELQGLKQVAAVQRYG